MIRASFITLCLFFFVQFSYAQNGPASLSNISSYTVPAGLYCSPTQSSIVMVVGGTSGNNYIDCPVTFNSDGNTWGGIVQPRSGSYFTGGSRFVYGNSGNHTVTITLNGDSRTINVKTYIGYATVVFAEY